MDPLLPESRCRGGPICCQLSVRRFALVWGALFSLFPGCKACEPPEPAPPELLHVYDLTKDILHPDRRGPRLPVLLDLNAASDDRDADQTLRFLLGRRFAPPPLEQKRALAKVLIEQRGLILDRLPLDGVWRVREEGSGYHAQEGGCGDFALDIDGGEGPGAFEENSAFRIFGAPVFAPVSGRVSVAIDHFPDHEPSDIKGKTAANAVFLQLRGAFAVGMYHFASRSVTATEGSTIAAGTPIGRAGNSGTSYAPHLHLGVYWQGKGAPKGSCHGWSVPFVFRSLYVSNRSSDAHLETNFYPRAGMWISNNPF